jgi:Tol biopolymer transport system component
VSQAVDIVPGDRIDELDVFRRDLVTRTTQLMSVGADGRPSTRPSGRPSISGHGQEVAFSSYADLAPSDTNGRRDVFVRSLQCPATTRQVSAARGGAQSDGHSESNAISPDGRYVVFESWASNLTAPPDTDGLLDVFLRDLRTGTTQLASQPSAG